MVNTKPKIPTSTRIIPQTIPMIAIIGKSFDDDDDDDDDDVVVVPPTCSK